MADGLPNSLYELHRQAGAEFQAYDTLQIVSTFGEPQAEYSAIHKGAGLMDQPHRGFIEVGGGDRHSFVNNLVTQQIWNKETKRGLEPGEGVYAFFLNTKGRIVADMNVLETGDRLLLEMDARQVEAVRAAFDKYRFVEKVQIVSRLGGLHQIALLGPGAPAALRAVAPDFAGEGLATLGSRAARLFDFDVIVWRDDVTGSPGLHLIVPADGARAIWMKLLAALGESEQVGKRVLRPIGWAAFNAARIEAGRPLFGIDFDATVLPAETGQLERAVSFTKGCYLGQEIVARMHARGQIARQIVGLRLDNDALPLAGSHIFAADDSGDQIGGITSSTLSPRLSNAAICLAIVKKGFNTAGAEVRVPAEGAMRTARVTRLPFIRPSE